VYSVSELAKEIGIHMPLGATRGSVLGMILGHGTRLTMVGLVAAALTCLEAAVFGQQTPRPQFRTSVTVVPVAVP
jgi:hypothetical protein